MKSPLSIQTIAVALNTKGTEPGSVPEWIQLTPAGPQIKGRDGRNWMLPNPEAVVAAFNNLGRDLPIDFEHATQVKGAKGEAAPAIGWIKELEVRQGAIWGNVEWNADGRGVVASKGYRYVSPVFTFKKATGDIVQMVSAGLTNNPNLKLAALNRDAETEESAMNPAILEALGLAKNASETDALAAIGKMKSDHETALNSAAVPDPDKFVPKADHELALNKISSFEEADKERRVVEITGGVDAAIEAGKIAPASRDYHIAACSQEGGLENFAKMVAASPEIAAKSDLDAKNPAKNSTQLSAEETAVCAQLGLDVATFKSPAGKQE